MRRAWLIALFAAVIGPASAAGADPAANVLVKLFMDVCIPDVGQPQKVRAWAEEHHLQEVTSQIALDLFVGPGGKGVAWTVPSTIGSFALSIRGKTEACAVWARAGMTLFDDEELSWGGSLISADCSPAAVEALWSHVQSRHPGVWLHDPECTVHTHASFADAWRYNNRWRGP
jgi:hypothetical protein